MINLQRHKKKIIKDTLKQLGALGSYQFHILITLLFFITQNYLEFVTLLIGYFIIKSIGIPFRILLFKERPKKEEYKDIFEKISSASFPSFHAARTSFLILILISYFNYYLPIILFLIGIGILILYSRIYFKRHYPIDIIAGLILGILTYLILNLYF